MPWTHERGEVRNDESCTRCNYLRDGEEPDISPPVVAFMAYKRERLCAACLRELLAMLEAH